MVDVAELTRATNAVLHNRWSTVLLAPRSKRPTGRAWQITSDVEVISRHLREGGNLGLVCGEASGVDVLDFDDLAGAQALFAMLGAIPVTVVTGSGKWHAYVRHEPGLPARIRHGDAVVGEVQRGPNQQVVMPPSVHPQTGRPYRWIGDAINVTTLSREWREYLIEFSGAEGARPSFLRDGDVRGAPTEEDRWEGPDAEEIVRRASMMPRAKRRVGGVKFQCPGCVAEGRDKHADNAIVRNDGRWGCAVAPGDPVHRRAIGVALGVLTPHGDGA